MLLRYQLEGDVMVTDQVSEPREERTKYFLDSEGKLSLFFGGKKSTYVRASKEAE
jgi:hypothetical protein